jgi:hypothetical protein
LVNKDGLTIRAVSRGDVLFSHLAHSHDLTLVAMEQT